MCKFYRNCNMFQKIGPWINTLKARTSDKLKTTLSSFFADCNNIAIFEQAFHLMAKQTNSLEYFITSMDFIMNLNVTHYNRKHWLREKTNLETPTFKPSTNTHASLLLTLYSFRLLNMFPSSSTGHVHQCTSKYFYIVANGALQ